MSFENKIKDCDELKKELDSLRPLSDEELKKLKEFYRVGQTYSSNALEGNTLTEVETKVIIEDGMTVSGKPLREIYEATGNAKAFDFMMEISKGELFSEDVLLKIHKLFFEQIEPDNAGVYRKTKVFISGTKDLVLPDPKDVPSLTADFIEELSDKKNSLHPIELASYVHNRFVTIHPFSDGNGRTARLLMNLILVQAGYPVTIIPPIYRVDYLNATRSGNDGDDLAFTNLLSCMVYEGMKDYLRMVE